MRHSVQTDILELVTDTHRADADQLTIGDALEAVRATGGIPAGGPAFRPLCPTCRTRTGGHEPGDDLCRLMAAERALKMREV